MNRREKMEKRGFHGRGFFSLLSFGGFIVLALTGIVLFIMPHGRVAYWTDWRFLGLTEGLPTGPTGGSWGLPKTTGEVSTSVRVSSSLLQRFCTLFITTGSR
jgi:hypothetical protein